MACISGRKKKDRGLKRAVTGEGLSIAIMELVAAIAKP